MAFIFILPILEFKEFSIFLLIVSCVVSVWVIVSCVVSVWVVGARGRWSRRSRAGALASGVSIVVVRRAAVSAFRHGAFSILLTSVISVVGC